MVGMTILGPIFLRRRLDGSSAAMYGLYSPSSGIRQIISDFLIEWHECRLVMICQFTNPLVNDGRNAAHVEDSNADLVLLVCEPQVSLKACHSSVAWYNRFRAEQNIRNARSH